MTQKDVPLKSRDTPPGPRRPGNIPARRPRASLSPRPSSRPPSEKTPQKSLHRILSLSRALSRRSRRPRRQLPRFSPRPSASRLSTWTLLTRHRARSRRSSTLAHRARPTVTPAFAVAIPRPRRGLRARAYASPEASPRSLARVAVGRRHPRVHFFQPLARFIALYRTIYRVARALFARDFSWSASPGRFTSHDSSARTHAGVNICGCGGCARACPRARLTVCAHPCAVRREVGDAWWSVAALSGTRAKAGRGRREDDARGMEEGVTSCLERCV